MIEQDIDYKGYKIKIRQDEFYESPNDWGDDEVFLVYDHRQFYVERTGFAPQSIYHYLYAKDIINSGNDVDNSYQEELESYYEYENYFIFPVEAYIHSGVSLSLFTGTKQCRWDSSVSGYILVSRTTQIAADDYMSVPEDKAKEYAEGLIETWNTYLSGDVWGYIVEKADCYFEISKPDLEEITNKAHGYINLEEFYNRAEEDHIWTEVDSCWGFYGQDAAINEAKLIIDYI
ncbi:MAG: hypothetical protein M0R03_23545 [Novosphingobium sp.]|nr:hypothetical protein [Novosphingobium sp.]